MYEFSVTLSSNLAREITGHAYTIQKINKNKVVAELIANIHSGITIVYKNKTLVENGKIYKSSSWYGVPNYIPKMIQQHLSMTDFIPELKQFFVKNI